MLAGSSHWPTSRASIAVSANSETVTPKVNLMRTLGAMFVAQGVTFTFLSFFDNQATPSALHADLETRVGAEMPVVPNAALRTTSSHDTVDGNSRDRALCLVPSRR